ncbi:unnamed protein product [Sphagnum tenellum]
MEHVTARAAVEASEDDSGPSSSFSLLEYEKASTQASIAQLNHMNPQEKLEKLRWQQQVQAQLAVEQRQLALWGLMAIDMPVLSQMPEPPGIMPVGPLKQSAISISSEISPQEPL